MCTTQNWSGVTFEQAQTFLTAVWVKRAVARSSHTACAQDLGAFRGDINLRLARRGNQGRRLRTEEKESVRKEAPHAPSRPSGRGTCDSGQCTSTARMTHAYRQVQVEDRRTWGRLTPSPFVLRLALSLVAQSSCESFAGVAGSLTFRACVACVSVASRRECCF